LLVLGAPRAQEIRWLGAVVSVDASTPAYDESAWQAYLTESGQAWNGTGQTWEQFRQWFVFHATERGLEDPATRLLDYLGQQAVTERISTLARYGVAIKNADVPGEYVAAQGEMDDEGIDSMLGKLAAELAERPEMAAMPEDLRREVIAGAMEEAIAEELAAEHE
jgi:hypothetical protein